MPLDREMPSRDNYGGDLLIVIPAGAKKLDYAAPAEKIYRGNYFRACLEYAQNLSRRVEEDGLHATILILSARYGLLDLDTTIDPYNLSFRQRGAITSEQIYHQAAERQLLWPSRRVIALGGDLYTRIVLSIWPHAELPLEGKGGSGRQISWMTFQFRKRITRGSAPPSIRGEPR